jgi:tRNA-dihydrouridine synthase
VNLAVARRRHDRVPRFVIRRGLNVHCPSHFRCSIRCAAALSSTADMLVRNCTKMGTEVLYMEIVIKCRSFAGERNEKKWKLSERQGHCHLLHRLATV